MTDFIKGLQDAFIARINNMLFVNFIVALIFVNYEHSLTILFKEMTIDEKIKYINDYVNFDIWTSLIIPLAIALIYIFALPSLNLLISILHNKIINPHIKDHENEKLKDHYGRKKELEAIRLESTVFVQRNLEAIKAKEENKEKEKAIELINKENKAKSEAIELINKENKAKSEAIGLINKENKANSEAIELTEKENKAKQVAIEQTERENKAKQVAIEQTERENKTKEEAFVQTVREKKAKLEAFEQTVIEKKAKLEAFEQTIREHKAKQEAIEQTERENKAKQEAIEQTERENKSRMYKYLNEGITLKDKLKAEREQTERENKKANKIYLDKEAKLKDKIEAFEESKLVDKLVKNFEKYKL